VEKLFKRILCPIDFDDNSVAALDLACKIAAQNEASICLLHVVSIPVPTELAPVPLEPYEVWEKDARGKLEQIARERAPANVEYQIVTAVGPIAPAIVQAVAARQIDLVIMSTHGRERSAVGHFFLGSVAERVVHESTCPVLVVPPR
jgi:nucleotide-binding universal stress UspA family protein